MQAPNSFSFSFSLKARTALAYLAGLPFPDSNQTLLINDYLKSFPSFERLTQLSESTGTCPLSLFLTQLREDLTKAMTSEELSQCSPECKCCLQTKHDRDQSARSDANERVARLIKDPLSPESSELLEMYAETALKSVCGHLQNSALD
jgi:hypothetical protein